MHLLSAHTHSYTHTHTPHTLLYTHTFTLPSLRYGWPDGLFDVTWSEVNEAMLVAAAGDGNVLIFDQNIIQVRPLMNEL